MKANINVRGIYAANMHITSQTIKIQNSKINFDTNSMLYGLVDNINTGPIVFDNKINIYCSPLEVVWPMVGHDAKQNWRSPFGLANSSGKIVWKSKTGVVPNISPVISASGTIVITGDNKLLCFDINGNLLWEHTFPDLVGDSAAIGKDGTIYVPCFDGKLYAFRADGVQKWVLDIGVRLFNSPMVYQDKNTGNEYILFVSNAGVLYFVDVEGNIIWSKENVNDQYISWPSVDDDGNIYIYTYSGVIHVFDKNGNLLWTYDMKNLTTCEQIHPMVSISLGNGGLYAGYITGFDCGYEGHIIKFDFDGNVLWTYKRKYYGPHVIVVDKDDSIYIPIVESVDEIFNLKSHVSKISSDGKLLWSIGVDGVLTTFALSDNGVLCFNSVFGYYAINTNGYFLWKINSKGSAPVIGPNNKLFFATVDKELVCVG